MGAHLFRPPRCGGTWCEGGVLGHDYGGPGVLRPPSMTPVIMATGWFRRPSGGFSGLGRPGFERLDGQGDHLGTARAPVSHRATVSRYTSNAPASFCCLSPSRARAAFSSHALMSPLPPPTRQPPPTLAHVDQAE